MKSIHALLFALFATSIPTVVNASHQSPLEAAACQYDEAVQQLKCAVRDVPFMQPCEVQLVCQLADAACAMNSVAGHPSADRVLDRWAVVKALHGRVAATIFARSCHPPYPMLIRSWELVACAYRDLAKQVECICHDHHVHRPAIAGPGFAFGLPPVAFPRLPMPQAVPGVTVPRGPYPATGLPLAFAPSAAHGQTQIRPQIAPPNPVRPPTEEIRYYGRRQLDSRHSLERYFDGNFRGSDFRSAMIGAMLSRRAF